MSSPVFEVAVDDAWLLAAMDRAPEIVRLAIRGQSNLTAYRIARDIRSRMHRSRLPHVHTSEGITVEETHDGEGFVVLVTQPREKNLPLFLEHGTQFMLAQPSVDVSARVEEPNHLARVYQAVREAIEEVGLGE